MDIRCEDFNILIDEYLAGELMGPKQEAFELHYFECDDCFAALKVAERLHSKEIPIVLKGKQPVSIFNRLFGWKPLTAMAAAAIVVVVSISMIRSSNRLEFLNHISDVAAPVYIVSETRNTKPDANTMNIQSRGGEFGFDEAMREYNRKNYSDALKKLNTIDGAGTNPRVIFFKGICLLYTGSLKDSIQQLDIIIEDMNPSYYDEAIYYKAIALLRSGKEKAALTLLSNLAEMFSPLSQKAKSLISKIKK